MLKIWEIVFGFVMQNANAAERAGLVEKVEDALDRVLEKLVKMMGVKNIDVLKLTDEAPSEFAAAVADDVAEVAKVLAGKGFIPLGAPPTVGLVKHVIDEILGGIAEATGHDSEWRWTIVRMGSLAIALLCGMVVEAKHKVIEDLPDEESLTSENAKRTLNEIIIVAGTIQQFLGNA